MGPDFREQILALLKGKGPLVPNDIKKVLKGDTMIFGAILSELASRGLVKISDMKKGGSPFYYTPDQENKLEGLVEFLNPKDQKTVQFLKEQRVVFDKGLELFQRVSLRKIKDYAKEMTVSTSDGNMLFWRYFLVSEQEALDLLKNRYNKSKAEPKKEVLQEKTLFDEAVDTAEKAEEKKKQEEENKEKKEELIDHPNIRKPASKSISNEKPVLKPKALNSPKQAVLQSQLTTSPGLEKTPFYDLVWNFFTESKIDVLEESMLSKDREYEFVISVPSVIGSISYYCRARNKKKLNEGDVAPALLKAKNKNMQLLFLTNGVFSKKSQDLMKKEFTGLIIKIF